MVNGKEKFTFYLPIPPQSMNIQDMSTSEAHATLGGVVEETSTPVFHLISLVGTTGLSSSGTDISARTVPVNQQNVQNLSIQFRRFIDNLNETTNPVARLIRDAVDGSVNFIGGLGDVEKPLQYGRSGSAVITGSEDQNINELISVGTKGKDTGFLNELKAIGERAVSSVTSSFTGDTTNARSIYANGYAWSHAMRQFFLIYRREKANNPELKLFFIDGKAGTRFRCVPRNIAFNQSAKNPFVVSYNLVLKCWSDNGEDFNLTDNPPQVDRFGPGGDLADVNTLTATALAAQAFKVFNSFKRSEGVIQSLVRNSTESSI
jgi:hypothetical protein